MYHKTVLDNGIRIVSEALDYFQSVCLGIWVDAGSRDETAEENGVSHFIEHMIFRGTHRRSGHQIARELDAIGGMSNAFTGKEHTCFHARVLAKHFDVLEDILSDIFLNSTFDPENLEREKQVILQEINMVEDTPDENIHVLFNRLFWMDHPIGMPILGTGTSVSGLTRETILSYIGRFYTPERILVAAAGKVEHERMVSYFERVFGSLGPNPSTQPRRTPRANSGVSVHSKDLEQVHICIGGEAPALPSQKRFACALLNTVLGGNMSSRLFQEIREKRGLAYSVYSFHSPFLDTGLLGIYAATDAQNLYAVLDIIQREVKQICKGDLATSDLSEAKDHLVGGIYLSSESVENRMMRIAKNELVFSRYVGYEELVENLERVKLAEVIEVAEEIFLPGKVSVAALGPLKEKDLEGSCELFGI